MCVSMLAGSESFFQNAALFDVKHCDRLSLTILCPFFTSKSHNFHIIVYICREREREREQGARE